MGRWTIALLRRVSPERRVHAAAWLFWITIALGAVSVVFLATSPYERVLMAISWGAITITCGDLILTADVRDNEDG